MKSLACSLVVASSVLAGGAVQAQPLVLYDDFGLPFINPNKWLPFQLGSQVRDDARLITANRLWLATISYADQTSDVGITFQGNGLTFANPTPITAIQSTFTVSGAIVTACGTNPGAFTAVQATIQGTFFNAGTPSPGHTTDDVFGAVYLGRSPSDPPSVLRSYFSVFQCLDDFCGNVANLAGGNLGTATTGQAVRLLLQWDQPNKRFVFRQDANPPVLAPYAVPDGASPGLPRKFVETANAVPNCTSAPRPAAFMSVLVGSVFVNP